MLKKIVFALAVFVGISAYASENPKGEIFEIWNGKVAGNVPSTPEVVKTRGKAIARYINNTQVPTLELFKVKANSPTPFVIICPGGGYGLLSYDNEGTYVAEYLNKAGISAAVLKYRTPNNRVGALIDAQRAIRFARANASAWNIDKDKIAIVGFSAGANLSARASTNYAKKVYENQDEIDNMSAKPNFTGLLYPAYCDEPTFQLHWGDHKKRASVDYTTDYKLADELPVDANTPPAFIFQAQDDNYWVNASVAYFLALKQAKVSVNLHFFDKGGHGFGLRSGNNLISQWPELFVAWFKKQTSKK